MEVYVFKHERTKTAYVRVVRQAKRIPPGIMRYSWLGATLLRALDAKTYKDGKNPKIYRHLLKNNLLLERNVENGKIEIEDWREAWTMDLYSNTVTQSNLKEVTTELATSLMKEGWVILNSQVRWNKPQQAPKVTVRKKPGRKPKIKNPIQEPIAA